MYRAYFDAADLEEDTAGAEEMADLDALMAADGEEELEDDVEEDEFLVEDGLDGLNGVEDDSPDDDEQDLEEEELVPQ